MSYFNKPEVTSIGCGRKKIVCFQWVLSEAGLVERRTECGSSNKVSKYPQMAVMQPSLVHAKVNSELKEELKIRVQW